MTSNNDTAVKIELYYINNEKPKIEVKLKKLIRRWLYNDNDK
jgi:hypothetical protein